MYVTSVTSASAYICIEPQVSCQGFHLKYTSNWILRICKEILQYFQYSLHSKGWMPVEKTSTGQNHDNYDDLVLQTI